MSRLTLPAREEILKLAAVRSEACVSIYLETSPLGLHRDTCRIELANQIKRALYLLEEAKLPKRRLAALRAMLDDVTGFDDFCLFQAESLALLATPEHVWQFRLANRLTTEMHVADRFYLKPLLRSLTFAHAAYVLALSENAVRVIELAPDTDPAEITVPDMPENAADALGLSSITATRGAFSRQIGPKGEKRRLALYVKKVDEALRPLLLVREVPLILAATELLASLYRSVASIEPFTEGIAMNADRLSVTELAELARPILDRYHARELESIMELFDLRAGQGRVITDVSDLARAVTSGMVGVLLVDFERAMPGTIDQNGKIIPLEESTPFSCDVIDEIVKRALETGARIVAVRAGDMIGGSDSGAAGILRHRP